LSKALHAVQEYVPYTQTRDNLIEMATHLETLDYRRHIENPFSEDFNEVANELKEWNYRVGRWEYRTIECVFSHP